MKLYLKENIYFKISVPDGTDRAVVTADFRRDIAPMFQEIVKTIIIDPPELNLLRKSFGDTSTFQILTESEFLKEMNSSK